MTSEEAPAPRESRVAEALEIPEILDLVGARCASRAGREALPRRPFREVAEAADAHDRIWSCRRVRAAKGGFRLAGDAPREKVERAGTEGLVLSPEVLLAVADAARAAREAKEQLGRDRGDGERFALEVEAIPDLPEYRKACDRTFDRRGEVRDEASPALSRIRARQRELEASVQRTLEGLVRGQARRFLSEDFFTQKDGRWVVPLASHFKGRVPGVVVGASGTGQTLYVEPFPVLELSNDLRAAKAEEEVEVLRILEELTALLGEHREDARTMLAQLAELDSLHARAAFADDHACEGPGFGEGGEIRITRARHLLLGEGCVPIELELTREARGLVLSGANAGGKTVALKILGTLTWLAASGYHVPVGEGSVLPFPRRIFCVIGDDQSLAHHLSSFSSHVSNVAEVLAEAGEGDLVLLDELMSGTDPEEGAALAVEVLLTLARRGCLSVTTTHYTAVKMLGEEHEGFENASVEFDLGELRPTYRILLGKAGPSRGFEIAQRYGLDAGLVDKARIRLGPERARLQELLSKIETDRVDAAVALDEAEALRAEVERSRAELERLRKVLKQERYEEARERAALLDEEVTELRRRVLSAIEEGRLDDAARAVEEVAGAYEELPEPPEKEGWEGLEVGDPVRVAGYGVVGTLKAIDAARGRATVDTGTMTLEVDRTRLEREGAPEGRGRGAGRGRARSPVRSPPSASLPGRDPDAPLRTREVHLLGMRVDEAREALDEALDRAAAESFDALRVIHGFGTGALRGLVDRMVRGHPLVESHRPGGEHEGGRGATVVVLK